jgi:hypothetical protein
MSLWIKSKKNYIIYSDHGENMHQDVCSQHKVRKSWSDFPTKLPTSNCTLSAPEPKMNIGPGTKILRFHKEEYRWTHKPPSSSLCFIWGGYNLKTDHHVWGSSGAGSWGSPILTPLGTENWISLDFWTEFTGIRIFKDLFNS